MNMRHRGNIHLQGLRSRAVASLLFVAGLVFAVPAALAEYAKETKAPEPWRAEISGPFDSKIRLEMYERVRGDFADWFGNPIINGTVVLKEFRYNFVGNKFQLGLRFQRDPVEIFAQFQDSFVGGLPPNGVGLGAVYFANNLSESANGAFLRQGWAKLNHLLGIDGLYLTGGRQLYTDAAQGPASHKNLRWIQDYRLAQRLIGPWDWTHTGRSFDGGSLGYLTDDIAAVGFAFRPTFGGFDVGGMPEISDITVAGTSFNLRDSKAIGNTIGQLFWYYYTDDRDIVFLDNRPLAVREQARGQGSKIHTIGAWAAHVEEIGPGLADGMVYWFGQFGDWQELDHGAWAYGAEAGYQFPKLWGSPWIRAGINSGSGDPDPFDGDHETFFQLLPTVWLYAQFPFYNMMNNQDVFVQGILAPHPKVNVRLDFHWLKVNESEDFLYSGSGATNDTFFGYLGTPTGGFDDLAYVTHFMVGVKPFNYLALNFFYAHAFGQDIINANFDGKQGSYGYVEAIVSF